MRVDAVETGRRPLALTKARMYAPQGVKVLAEILTTQNWGHRALVALDWQPEEFANDPAHRDDAVLRIYVWFAVPEKKRYLEVNWVLDANDVFSSNDITRDDLIWVISGLEDKVRESLARAGVAT